jgi:hypothetical protein
MPTVYFVSAYFAGFGAGVGRVAACVVGCCCQFPVLTAKGSFPCIKADPK